jgi:hypothetical protein
MIRLRAGEGVDRGALGGTWWEETAHLLEAEKATSTATQFRLSSSRPGEFNATENDERVNSHRYKISKTCEKILWPNCRVSLIVSHAKPIIKTGYEK